MKKLSNYEIFNYILNTNIANIRAIKSIVNKTEKTPSLKFYYNNDLNDWFFKDFSSGEHGGPIKFLMLLENISYDYAKQKVWDICNNYGHNNTQNVIPQIKKQIIYEYDIVPLDDEDLKYWSRYNIGKELLIKHNVYSIVNFKVNNYLYNNRWIGYFDDIGTLLQVYAPANSIYNDNDKKKFFVLKHNTLFYCNNNSDKLIITKSKKDLIVLDSIFGNKYSYVSWIGETKKIEKNITFLMLINKYKEKYINFDNDKTGIKRMEELEKYNLKPLMVNGYKDASDYIASNGNVKEMFNIKLEL